MAQLKNCEVHYVKCNPERPNAQMDKESPTWEVQLRTTNPEQKKEWETTGLRVKLIVGKEGEPNEGEAILTEKGEKQWKANVKKRSKKKDGSASDPVAVINGALTPIDPDTIGNGSIANIRVFQRDYTAANGDKKVACVLMGIQVTRHLVYKARDRNDDFEASDTDTIMPAEEPGDDVPSSTPKAPSMSTSVPKLPDSRDENAF